MNKENKLAGWQIKFIYLMLGSILLGLLWNVTNPEKMRGVSKTSYSIVTLGDSVLGECRDETSVTAQLSELLQTEVFNGAFGGTTLSQAPRERRICADADCLSMSALVQAIVTGDFGVQQSFNSRENATEYFSQTIDALEKIDFSEVDILLLEYGLNDYHAGHPLDNPKDEQDVTTFLGALRYSISLLRKEYPSLRIILVTPVFTWYTADRYGEDMTGETYETGKAFLNQYVDAELQFAKEAGLEIIDVYHDFYPHEKFEDWMLYSHDGLHPNESGRRILAETIYAYLNDTGRER
ncbi:MAG: SGNH/GDSL hydrolase family protein [Acetatifactor sp.]|nr:SGNH/GDSL hydrolase family protein [Acetatifactor sp.]